MDTLNTTEDKTVEKTFGQTISKERLEDIFQAVLDGITVQDTSGRVIYANLSAAKVLGFSSVNDFIDAVNSGIWGSVRMYDEHGNHLDPNLLPGRKVLKGEQSSKLVVKWSYNHHPQEKWSEISASPIFEESGKLLMVVNIFHDITETKLAELEVLRTNRRNRHILESIKDAFVVLDNEGRFLDMNSNAEFVFKKTARELIGKSVWDILPEAKGTEVEQKFHEVILSRLPATFQERYTGNVWFEYDFYPIREGLAVYFRDISQQKNSERYVSELAAIIESSNDAIISKDLDGIITSWNHGAEKLYGYKSHEIVGRSISIIIPENLQNELENILEKIKEGIKIEHYDTVRRKKDGSTIHVSISISPVKDAMGRIIGASVIARDVTHRKVEEQKQALTNKRNQHILDVISTRVPGLITVYNINTGVYTYVNEAVEKILDYSPEEFIKGGVKFVASLVHPDDIGSIMDQNQKLLELANNPKHAKEQDKTVAIFQYRMRHKNGTYRWLQTFGGIFDRDVNGKVDHVMNISVDITQQKETEEKLKVLSNELESKVQERTFELAQNEKRFRSLIENSIDGIALLDENATFKYVSPAITKMLGYESNELVGRNGFELMHLDDKERVFAVFTDLLSKNPGDIAQAEYRYLHKNGSWRWIEAQGNNLLNEEGVKAIVVNYRDITDRKLAEDALRISERRFAMFMQYLPGLAWIKDIEGKYVYVNDSAEQAFGKPRAEIYNRTDDQIFSTETAEQFKNNDIKVIESGIGVQAIETLNQSDGVHHSVVSKFPIFGHNSQVIMVGGVAIDISERLQAEKALNESLERYSSLISATSSVVWTTDPFGNIKGRQPSWEQYTGQEWNEYKDNGWIEAIHPDDRKGVTRAWIDALEKKSQFFVTGRVWHKNSESYRHFESRGVAIKDSDGNIREWIGTITDIHDKLLVEKEKQLAQEQMEYTYLHDSLTDLPNRILFNQRLLEEINKCDEKKTLLSVMIIDLDRFKMINESLGHAVGDRLLQEVGLRLASCLDETDVLARLGGDEFGILLTDIEREEEVASVCQRILDSLKHPFSVDKNELYMTPSVGITVFPFDGDDSSTLLKNADSALYRAKEQGRNNFQFYNPSMNATSFQQLTLESALRRALKNNEFLVYYQPQIDPITGHIVELEALLRWMHPDLGLTFPDEFIKSAETTGLIESIGEWVLRTALKDVSEWHAMGFDDLDIAVNLSARQFKQRHLVRAIRKVINEIKFDASHLELELTESVLVDNSTTVFNTLNELKKDGIRFAIDDFNTGYSSLNYIKRFPIDILKIDKSFVRGLPGKEKDAAIANSIINLAHSLNMKVVAEGVERVEQLNFLRDRGCDKVQGYFISPPVSSQAITELLRKNK